MLKLSETPPAVSSPTQTIKEIAGPWWIAHTKARFEKAFAWDLIAKGIDYFLPMFERVTVSGGKKRRHMAPLFTSYVFFAGDGNARYTALSTDRLCQVIQVNDQAKLVRELSALETALAAKVPMDLYPFAAVGRRCRIKSGALMGIEGIVIQRDRTTRLVLQVSDLVGGAALEIEPGLLEPAEE